MHHPKCEGTLEEKIWLLLIKEPELSVVQLCERFGYRRSHVSRVRRKILKELSKLKTEE